ncbi:phosphoglycerate mutase family protein [Gillisia limnaea]|uniref:Phosphoglycerate mutase n=1 Tax=Gillisia limnaea (strain DSM 15749 / LMG 21470 / R-8282) TaxID=865937 RepID=H2BTX7_GILLR|nr:phosphoglycerate mutase family protein [Gillisia limnaea]EHQ03791.1 Phosphoglycerate mutase [Gillisia limnaea DSM 15749]
MKKLVLLLSVLMAIACNSDKTESSAEINSEKMTQYYFIRHAEKDTVNAQDKDPLLTEQGIKRAENWAKVFKEIPFDLIYSSDYKRTKSTAQIIADSQKKKVQLYNSKKLNDTDFQENTKGKTVLVIGHSNTNPKFVNYILGQEKYQELSEENHGSLFIVNVSQDSTKSSQVLHIN